MPYDASNIGRARPWVARARAGCGSCAWTSWFSFAVYTLATLAFYFLGAAVLFGRGGKGLPGDIGAMLNELSQMYVPVMGARGPKWFIVIGVLRGALLDALLRDGRQLPRAGGLPAGEPPRPPSAPAGPAGWVRLFCVLFPLIDLVLYLSFGNAVKMVMYRRDRPGRHAPDDRRRRPVPPLPPHRPQAGAGLAVGRVPLAVGARLLRRRGVRGEEAVLAQGPTRMARPLPGRHWIFATPGTLSFIPTRA